LSTPLSPAALAEAGRRFKALGDELGTAEEQWLEASEALETSAQLHGID
jgi:ATP-binding cassette subfamily F protein 3